MITQGKAIKIVGMMMMIGLCSKALGFVRELVIAHHFGVNAATDAFNIAFSIPGIFLPGIGTAIATTFIPTFTHQVENQGREAALGLTHKLLTLICLGGVLLSSLGTIFSFPLTHLLAPKFNHSQTILASDLTKILLATGAFSMIFGLCTGYLQVHGHFIVLALASYPLNITIILILVCWAGNYGIYSLAVAWAIATVIQFLFIVPSMLRTGFRFIPSFDFRDPALIQVVHLIIPVFTGTILLQVNTVIDRVFASGLPVGTISALNYAGRINNLVISIIAVEIAAISLPNLSRAAALNDIDRLKHTMLEAVRGINLIVIPITIGMVVLRVPLIQLIYQRGIFDKHATTMTATALCYLSVGLFAYGLREIISRVFYALNDTITPMINSGITVILNILLIFLLAPVFGMAGLAGATSISGVFSGIQLLFRLRHKIGSVHGLKIAVSFFKILLASLGMGFFIAWIYPWIRSLNPGSGFFPQLWSLMITTMMSAPLYGIVLLLLKEETLLLVTVLIKQKYFKVFRKLV